MRGCAPLKHFWVTAAYIFKPFLNFVAQPRPWVKYKSTDLNITNVNLSD